MIDREKVINDLQDAVNDDWMWQHADYYAKAMENAIALLKEQEAVEPICQIIFDVPYYFCGSCKTMLNMYAVKAKYCSNCARRVKWK